MASKKKLRKQIRDLEIRLAGSQAREHSLKLDIHTLIEGKDIARIQQIKIRSNIEYEFDENVWLGNRVAYHPPVSDKLARTYFGNGFFHQIQNCSEYEQMNQAHANKVSDFLSDFKKPEDALHDEKFKYEELEKRFCQPTQVNPQKDGYSMLNKDIESPKIEKRGPIIKMLSKTQKETEADIFINKSGDELSIGNWVELFPNHGGQPLKIKSFFVDFDAAFPGIMALTEDGKWHNIDYLTPINKTDGLKEEEKKEGGHQLPK